MDAGHGAAAQAVKAAAAVEEARRKLAAAQRRQHAWEAGAEGERRTAQALAGVEAQGWVVLHDLHWPGRPLANLDHVAVGPGGVVVIDSKMWSGRIDVKHGTLRQNGYRRSEALEGATAAAAAVAALLEPQHRLLVSSVICLVDQPTPAHQPALVQVISSGELAEHLRQLPSRLAPQDVDRVAGQLRRVLAAVSSPSQVTTSAASRLGGALEGAAARRRPAPRRPSPHPAAPERGGVRPRSGRPSNRRRQESLVVGIAKTAGVLLLALVVLPRMIGGIAELSPNTPTPAPAVTMVPTSQPSTSP